MTAINFDKLNWWKYHFMIPLPGLNLGLLVTVVYPCSIQLQIALHLHLQTLLMNETNIPPTVFIYIYGGLKPLLIGIIQLLEIVDCSFKISRTYLPRFVIIQKEIK